MKYILIFSDHNLENPSGAAYSRMINYAKAITRAENVKVILCSFQHMDNTNELFNISDNIYYVGIYNGKLKILKKYLYPFFSIIFLIRINRYLRKLDGIKIVFVFSMKLYNDLFILVNFKLLKNISVYVEKNELLHTIEISSSQLPIFKKLIVNILNFLSYLVKYANDKMVCFYDGVIVISTSIEKWVNKYNSNTLRIPILIDMSNYSDIIKTKSLSSNEFHVAYAGSISNRKDGVLILINAIKRVRESNIKITLDLFGSGSKYEIGYLIDFLLKFEIDYIHFNGNVEYSILTKLLPDFDLLVLPRPFSKQANFGFSTKLADYLASGVPTLTTNISDNSLYLKDSYNAYLIDVKELTRLDEVIIKVISTEGRLMIGWNGKKTAKEFFDYSNYTQQIIEFLK